MKVKLRFENAAHFVVAMMMLACLAVSASAQTVLIDFGRTGSFRGVSVPNPDQNGNYWNSIAPGPFIADLIDTNNAVTTIDIGFDTPVGTDSFNGPAGATTFPEPTAAEIAATDIDEVALGNLGVKTAAIDFAAGPSLADNRVRFQIQGLDPLQKYDLTLFGSHRFSTDATTVYSLYTDDTYSTLVATDSLNVQDPISPWLNNRDSVVTFSNLTPQTSNIFYVEFVGATGAEGYLNSLQISTAVPEPTAMLLLISGATALCVGFRRR